MNHAGIVLAGGASERMGQHKALLETPAGTPLAVAQHELLSASRCTRVVVVLGHEAESIAPHLGNVELAINSAWKFGRFSSVQAGLQHLPGHDGYFILPVDTPGVSPDTFKAMRLTLARCRPPALRPYHKDEPGHLVWISAGMASNMLAMTAGDDVRLDELLRWIEARIDVDDPAVLHNANTPKEWKRVREWLSVNS